MVRGKSVPREFFKILKTGGWVGLIQAVGSSNGLRMPVKKYGVPEIVAVDGCGRNLIFRASMCSNDAR